MNEHPDFEITAMPNSQLESNSYIINFRMAESEKIVSQESNSHTTAFEVDSFTINASLGSEAIHIRAFSQLTSKLFEANIANNDLNDFDQRLFGGIDNVFELMQNCIKERRSLIFNEAGCLSLPYAFRISEKFETQRTVDLQLKEVELGELHRLTIKFERYEAEREKFEASINDLLKGSEKQQRERLERM